MTVTDELMRLTEPGELQRRLDGTFRTKGFRNASVGLSYRGCEAVARLGDNYEAGDIAIVPAGCVTKLFTADLIYHASAQKLLRLDDKIAPFFPIEYVSDPFSQITVLQLLNHMHGLDDSNLQSLPLRSDGFIDIRGLCTMLSSVAPIATAGQFYSYGNAGAWLCAGILESLYGLRYLEVLKGKLLEPLKMFSTGQVHPSVRMAPIVCAATGGSLSISVEDLLTFLKSHIVEVNSERRTRCAALGGVDSNVVSLPGWHSIERGVGLGWKYYDHGWSGHNSEVPGSEVFVRINSTEQIGVVVESNSHPPTVVANALFRSLLPTLVDFRLPKLITVRKVNERCARRYAGRYGNEAMSILVWHDLTDALLVEVRRLMKFGTEAISTAIARLIPAEDNIFFARPALPELFTFVQFIDFNDSKFQYVWTGTQVLPRTSDSGIA